MVMMSDWQNIPPDMYPVIALCATGLILAVLIYLLFMVSAMKKQIAALSGNMDQKLLDSQKQIMEELERRAAREKETEQVDAERENLEILYSLRKSCAEYIAIAISLYESAQNGEDTSDKERWEQLSAEGEKLLSLSGGRQETEEIIGRTEDMIRKAKPAWEDAAAFMELLRKLDRTVDEILSARLKKGKKEEPAPSDASAGDIAGS